MHGYVIETEKFGVILKEKELQPRITREPLV